MLAKTKPWLFVGLVLVAIVGTAAGIYYVARLKSTDIAQSLCVDPNNVNSHVYNPSRLQTVKDCITVSGTVDSVIAEDDGDYHIWFHVDQQYASLPNSANDNYRQGDLLAEIICATKVNQQDAILACENYSNKIPIPSGNQNITVTGPYVLDSYHGWMEVHPVYSLIIS